jgi:hypothetical protein
MKVLQEELKKGSAQSNEKDDLEGASTTTRSVGGGGGEESSSNQWIDRLQYQEEKIQKFIKDFYKSKYLYEEAENPDEFFLPYIWTNIVSTLPFLLI